MAAEADECVLDLQGKGIRVESLGSGLGVERIRFGGWVRGRIAEKKVAE